MRKEEINLYRKILKITPGAYIFQRPFLRGLFLKGPLLGGAHLWASLILGRKFTVFALFLYLRAISKYKPPGAYICFLHYKFGGRGAYIWRDLYMEGHIFGILLYVLKKLINAL